MTNYQPPVSRWTSVEAVEPPVGEVVLIHDGEPDSNYPVTAFVGPGPVFLRTDGTMYDDGGISYWMPRSEVPPPPPQHGRYEIGTVEEAAMFFDSMRGLAPVGDWNPADDKRIKYCRTMALNHLMTDYTADENSAGAKNLGFEPVKPIVVVYVWQLPWPKTSGREDKGFTSDLMVVCRSPEGNPECLDNMECKGTCKEHRPTPVEIEEECEKVEKNWMGQWRRQSVLLNGRLDPNSPLTGDLADFIQDEVK